MSHNTPNTPFHMKFFPHAAQTSPGSFVSAVLAQLGLGNQYMPKNIPLTLLLSELHNPVWQIRVTAAYRLGISGEEAAVGPLVKSLQQDKIKAVKVAAARALGELADYAPVEALIAALDDPADDVKSAAAWALGELGERILTSLPLENLLNSSNSIVRATAIRSLGDLGVCTPLRILAAALQDADWQVREMASLALANQNDYVAQHTPPFQPEEQNIL